VQRFENPTMTEPVPGKYTYDFGQNIAGVVSIRVKGAAGVRVTIRQAEMLNTDIAYQNPGESAVKGGDGPSGTVYRANFRDANVGCDYYTLKGKPEGETYTPRFTYQGFRYVEISGVDAPIPPADVTALAFSSDNEQTSAFECSNAKVNKLYSNLIWGMRGNFMSVPTDSPNRDERLGYTDSNYFIATAAYLSNSDQFYNKWLRDFRAYQLNEETSERDAGLIPVIIPAVRVSKFLAFANFWGDTALTLPWLLYRQYGDVRVIWDSYISMRAYVDFLNAPPRTNDFLRPGSGVPRDNAYGDWVPVEKSPTNMTSTLGTAYVNKLLGKMAAIIGETDDAKKYTDIYNNIVQAFNKAFRNADGTLTANTQCVYSMVLYYGLTIDDNDRVLLAQALAKNVRDHKNTLTTGMIGTVCLIPALSLNQQAGAAYALLEQEEYPSWIYSINQGATTLWERWNSYTLTDGFGPVGMNSFNHYSFGSVGEWLFSGVLGIRYDEFEPGFRHFFLDPRIGGSLTYARGHYDSVVGRIESSWTWNRESGEFLYNVTVPANTRSTVFIPADVPLHVTEGKEKDPAYGAEGVTYIGYNADSKREIFDVASGTYIFGSSIKTADN
jgi:alpha-L-rhamnosidase